MANRTNFDDETISGAFIDLYKNGCTDALDELCMQEDFELLEARNFELIHNRGRRARRLRLRLGKLILNGEGLFLTLTFRDEVLQETSVETRRKYVQRFLKSCGFYVANIDFGEKHGREHYHAIVNSRVDLKKWAYGSINMEHIRKSSKSNYCCSKYLTKLTCHAIKKSTGHKYRIMYSKA